MYPSRHVCLACEHPHRAHFFWKSPKTKQDKTRQDRTTDRQTDRQTDRHRDRQTDRQRDRQTDRQTDRHRCFERSNGEGGIHRNLSHDSNHEVDTRIVRVASTESNRVKPVSWPTIPRKQPPNLEVENIQSLISNRPSNLDIKPTAHTAPENGKSPKQLCISPRPGAPSPRAARH